MAINLWGLSQPTSYNPLPTGWGNYVSVRANVDYVINFKAKSNTKSLLTFDTGLYEKIQLENEFNTFTRSVKTSANRNIGFATLDGGTDIIIEDIQLVEKPLPKITLNGIDGFLSGKWSLHVNATVIDDETLELDATGTGQRSTLKITVEPNMKYILQGEPSNGAFIGGKLNGSTYEWIQNSYGTKTFTTGTTQTELEIELSNGSNTGKFTFKRPMLVLGTTKIPFEPKRGERMVEPVARKNLISGFEQGTIGAGAKVDSSTRIRTPQPIPTKLSNFYTVTFNHSVYELFLDGVGWISTSPTTLNTITSNSWVIVRRKDGGVITPSESQQINAQLEQGTIATPHEPYAVQLNPKPKRYVPKKNLIPSFKDSRWNKHANLTVVGDYEAVLNATSDDDISDLRLALKTNTNYTIEMEHNAKIGLWDSDKLSFLINRVADKRVSFNTGSSKNFVLTFRNHLLGTGQFTFKEPMLVEGSTAQAFEPYQEVLPRAKTGLRMDGTQYVQLPSMTMDSIEIDCLIEPKNSGFESIVDARSGSGYFLELSSGTTRNSFPTLTGLLKNERTTIRVSGEPFTDNVNIFSNYAGSVPMKGTLYAVKCYLNGQVVAEYDFTNPNNIVGDKLIPNAKNLIPSFEDEAWNLHSNFKVFGPNVGQLDATATWQQGANIRVEAKPNKSYLFIATVDKTKVFVDSVSESGVKSNLVSNSSNVLFTTKNDTKHLEFPFTNTSTTGSFDFINPQLYELTGKEAQLFGSPTPQLKAPKRLLYAKR